MRSPYNAAVSGTSGLIDYWRLGETSGTSLADAVGGRNATAQNGVDARRRRARSRSTRTQRPASTAPTTTATAPLNLSGTRQSTVEFWLKWTHLRQQRRPGLRVHPELRQHQRRLLHQPQLEHPSGRFEVGIGRTAPATTPTSPGPRPTSGTTTRSSSTRRAAAAQLDHLYVDGQPVSITKGSSGTGAGNFANSTLYFMSRGGSSLFGDGSLDEVAIYDRGAERHPGRTTFRG